MTLWREARRRREQDCVAAWNAFPELAGSHWQLRQTEGQWQILTSAASALALVNPGVRWPQLFPEYRPVRTVQVVEGPTYRRRQTVIDGMRTRQSFLDAYLGVTVLETVGQHRDRSAGGTIRLVGGSGGDQIEGAIRFPVEATRLANAVMRAVDESGASLLHVRQVRAEVQKHFRLTSDTWFDIVAAPGLKATPELLLMAAVGAPWLIGYFQSGG